MYIYTQQGSIYARILKQEYWVFSFHFSKLHLCQNFKTRILSFLISFSYQNMIAIIWKISLQNNSKGKPPISLCSTLKETNLLLKEQIIFFQELTPRVWQKWKWQMLLLKIYLSMIRPLFKWCHHLITVTTARPF